MTHRTGNFPSRIPSDNPSMYTEYLSPNVVVQGLNNGSLFKGKLRTNSMYPTDGYITVEGLSSDILIDGVIARNRALHGDLVAVSLHPVVNWKLTTGSSDKKRTVYSSADNNENVLQSLWRPSVQTDWCFERSCSQVDETNTLQAKMTRINELIRQTGRRPTANVVFVFTPPHDRTKNFVGSLESFDSNSLYAYFNANDLRVPRRIRIPVTTIPTTFIDAPKQYKKTMLCSCRITEWSVTDSTPTGEFVKIIGEYTDIETGISAVLLKHGLQAHTLDFDSSILTELDDKYGTSGEKWEVPEEELLKRRDFRKTQIFSIDPYNARDLDDALHIRALNDARTKFEIGVHIADVTHFIEHNSLLDREARSRATSVYLANRVLPMLPRILCEKLCSLQPQVDRLAFSVVWQMNVDGTLVDGVEPWFGKSIIRSCCKLDYGSAQKMLDGVISSDNVDEWEVDRRPIPGANPDITNATVIQSVKDLWSIGVNRRALRFETGAVSLNDIKIVFSLDDNGIPTEYGPYELKDSNRLVVEFMLLANFVVAQQLLRAHGPLAFLRHQSPPIQRSMDRALTQLTNNKINVGETPKQLMESLTRIREERGEQTFNLVQAMLIKTMKSAEYIIAGNGTSPESWRHYALNIPYYTHFTSPLRRYADIVVHRLLEQSLVKDHFPAADSAISADKDLKSRLADLTSLAQNCSELKNAAEYTKTDCEEVYLCAYVRRYGDIEVTGVVESMGQSGFTVYISELGMTKRLFIKDLKVLWKWNKNTSQLSIHLLEDGALTIQLSFMKQIRMRLSTTKTMPLGLIFAVVGDKK